MMSEACYNAMSSYCNSAATSDDPGCSDSSVVAMLSGGYAMLSGGSGYSSSSSSSSSTSHGGYGNVKDCASFTDPADNVGSPCNPATNADAAGCAWVAASAEMASADGSYTGHCSNLCVCNYAPGSSAPCTTGMAATAGGNGNDWMFCQRIEDETSCTSEAAAGCVIATQNPNRRSAHVKAQQRQAEQRQAKARRL